MFPPFLLVVSMVCVYVWEEKKTQACVSVYLTEFSLSIYFLRPNSQHYSLYFFGLEIVYIYV